MNANIHPCPPELSRRLMELYDVWKRMEITDAEYNKRLIELENEIVRIEMAKEQESKG